MLVLVALLIPVVAVLAAFAVDLAWIQLARTELRTATDAAARAGGKALSLYQDVDVARDLAIEIAARNEVTGRGLSLRPDEIEFGSGVLNRTTGRFEFTPGVARPNSVRVVGNRTGASTDGPVGLFFGQLIGLPTVDTSQVAVSTVLDRDICIVIDRSGSMGLDIDFSGTGNGQ
ncbi:MAG: pilus assembly protein TadG-related protein, partial [Planctomycetota bacterium]